MRGQKEFEFKFDCGNILKNKISNKTKKIKKTKKQKNFLDRFKKRNSKKIIISERKNKKKN